MARLDARERERERTLAARRRTSTWWGFGTISATAAAVLLMWGKVGQEPDVVATSPTPSPAVQRTSPSPAAPVSEPTPGEGGRGGTTSTSSAPSVAAKNVAARRNAEADGLRHDRKEEESHRAAVHPRSDSLRVADVAWHPVRRRSRDGGRFAESRRIAAADKHPAKPTTGAPTSVAAVTPKRSANSVWTDETVTRDDYRVLVPVVLTQSDGDGSDMTATPAVIEVAYDPHAAQMAGY
jgi:hypothetical protein